MFRISQDKEKRAYALHDVSCAANLQGLVCEGIQTVVIKLRGVCEFSQMDNTFSMVEGDINKRRFFVGNTGWKIFWDADRELWKLGSAKMENMVGLHTDFEAYPLGKKFWNIVNDTKCNYPNPERVLFNISPCNSSSFTCDDGSCIPMTDRSVLVLIILINC